MIVLKRLKTTKTNICDRIIITLLPLVLGVIGAVILGRIFNQKMSVEAAEGLELVKTVFDVWGVLLGFIFTAVSILLTVGENSFITTLIETNHMQNIIYSYVTAGLFLFSAIVFALVLLFTKIWNRYILAVFLGLNITIVTAVAISVYFLFAIVLSMHK